MKKILLILILFTTLFPQEKYIIYFSDKGISKEEFSLQKTSLLKKGDIKLSERAIERRKKVLGDDFFSYKDLAINESYISQITSIGIKIENKLKWFNAVSAYLTDNQKREIKSFPFVQKIDKVRKLKSNRGISKLQPIYSESVTSQYSLDYGESLVQNGIQEIPIVQEAGLNGEGIIIGFLDSGFNWEEHPALKDLDVLYEYDYIQDDAETKDQAGDVPGQDAHGTAVFSIGAGFANGELIGPAYGASFLLAKTDDIGTETRSDEDNFAAAVEDFEEMGADVITASLGYSVFDTEEESYSYSDMNGNTTLATRAYNYAYDLGVVTVNAAGNEGNSNWHYITAPSDAFGVISVGNINNKGILNITSSRGPTADGRLKPEVVAMGTNNYHAVSGGQYSSAGYGTSYSAPLVAGMVGELLSAYPYLKNHQVRNIVLHSGDNVENPNNDYGYGIMSARRALNYPNIWEYSDGRFKINKMFLGDAVDNESAIQVYYKINNGLWMNEDVNSSENNIQTLTLPETAKAKDKVEFYYTYNDTLGVTIREPHGHNYYAVLADSNVKLITGVIEFPDELTNDYQLYQNYPNPFNPTTTIQFTIPTGSTNYDFSQQTQLIVYDILGRKIKTLVNEDLSPGNYKVSFDASSLASGIYFYKLSSGSFVRTKKMMVLK